MRSASYRRANCEGFPCLDATTWTILSAYYDSLLIEQAQTRAPDLTRAQRRRHAKRGPTSVHIGARIAGRVTLVRVDRALTALPGLAFRGPANSMLLRRLGDCLELRARAEDMLLQRPTAARRRTGEFAAATQKIVLLVTDFGNVRLTGNEIER